ncbi:MAG: bifunctional riboflavin kinase/FMN adenylyltransferase [Oscillospiraceae bacterium]|nr:bifunctional riboflavin kinase/FMN adenylyltransferase [Oscillospiraceae bacterium]
MSRIIALGSFDGLHIGHMAVLRDAELPAAHCLLFNEHPSAVLWGNPPPRLLNDEMRGKLLKRIGVEPIILPFAELRALSPQEFVSGILAKRLGSSGVVCGYNYRFGAHAAGDAEELARLCRSHGIACRVVPPVLWDGTPVSATRIREALLTGDTAAANAMLGRAFGFDFTILHGDARGRLLGYPTANQLFPAGFLVPRRGVYASRVTLDGKACPAMTNIGLRPTFEGSTVIAETHVFGYSGDLYEQNLPVELLRFTREERAFADAEKLTAQLRRDELDCRR